MKACHKNTLATITVLFNGSKYAIIALGNINEKISANGKL